MRGNVKVYSDEQKTCNHHVIMLFNGKTIQWKDYSMESQWKENATYRKILVE